LYWSSSSLPHIPGGTKLNGCYNIIYGGPCETEIDGQGASFPGLVVDGSGSKIDNMAVHGFTDGVVLAGSGGNEVGGADNGTTPNGYSPASDPNSGDGLLIQSGSVGNMLNQDSFAGNAGWGIELQPGADSTQIDTSWIGVSPQPSTIAIPNALGGILVNSNNNLIGDGFTNSHCGDSSPPPVCYPIYVSGNSGPGIVLGPSTSGNLVANAFVGLNTDATVAVPNHGDGIVVGGTRQTLGGPNQLAGDLISGNTGNGITLTGSDSLIQGNLLGEGIPGEPQFGNGLNGILVSDSAGTVGDHTIEANTIGGNGRSGVEIDQTGVTLSGNTIGLSLDGTNGAPNGGAGITATRGPTRIGGDATTSNVIASNAGPGIAVSARTVRIQANAISANGGLGIAYPADPVAAPLLTAASAAGGGITFHGSLTGLPNTAYSIDLYSQPTCDPSGAGQGRKDVGAGFAFTDSTGKAFFGYAGPGAFAQGDVITATATDFTGTTSQFSGCATAAGAVDLTLTQSVNGSAVAGKSIDLVLSVANHGPAIATNVTINETLPSGATLLGLPGGCDPPVYGGMRCLISPIAAGGSGTLDLLLSTPAAGSLTNVASVSADQVEAAPADNSSTTTIPVADGSTPTGNGPGPYSNLTEPRPVLGRFLRLDHVSGTVSATLPDGTAINLTKFALVPVGTQVEASHGVAMVTAALPNTQAVAIGEFHDSAFVVTQRRRGTGLVNLTMVTPLPGCAPGAADRSKAHHPRPRRSRHLWGDAHGHFITTGRWATAEVHGTHWKVADTCRSTTVTVVTGRVRASPLANAKPAAQFVTTGHSVVFRPKR